jgi:chorismate mutase
MSRTLQAVRAAIQVRENSAKAISEATVRLVGELLRRNAIGEEDIVSIVFSLTRDLDRANPATGLRTIGFTDTALFCLQEAYVVGQMPRVIRVLLTYRAHPGRTPVPVYLDGAEALRPDLDR